MTWNYHAPNPADPPKKSGPPTRDEALKTYARLVAKKADPDHIFGDQVELDRAAEIIFGVSPWGEEVAADVRAVRDYRAEQEHTVPDEARLAAIRARRPAAFGVDPLAAPNAV
jgi:hypothetical protein